MMMRRRRRRRRKRRRRRRSRRRRRRRRMAFNTYAQMSRAQLCANHVQHIERLSRATCRVACHVVRRDRPAIKFDRV